jgi:hypothetical protein
MNVVLPAGVCVIEQSAHAPLEELDELELELELDELELELDSELELSRRLESEEALLLLDEDNELKGGSTTKLGELLLDEATTGEFELLTGGSTIGLLELDGPGSETHYKLDEETDDPLLGSGMAPSLEYEKNQKCYVC